MAAEEGDCERKAEGVDAEEYALAFLEFEGGEVDVKADLEHDVEDAHFAEEEEALVVVEYAEAERAEDYSSHDESYHLGYVYPVEHCGEQDDQQYREEDWNWVGEWQCEHYGVFL